jgi:hypothetical protein
MVAARVALNHHGARNNDLPHHIAASVASISNESADRMGRAKIARKFHTAENILAGDVPGDPTIENIAEAKVHNHLGWCGGELNVSLCVRRRSEKAS